MGNPNMTSAVLIALDLDTRLRFVPALDAYGTFTLTFFAWDQTAETHDATARPAIGALSTASGTVRVCIMWIK